MSKEICFVLPVSGGSGGAHSVVQEVDALRSLGIGCALAVNKKNIARFLRNYERFQWVSSSVFAFEGPKDLAVIMNSFETVVATTNTSVYTISAALKTASLDIQFGYYVQDYEPFFYAPGTDQWKVAAGSYDLVDKCVMFAKTSWLCGVVNALHGRRPVRVVPSIDHEVYFPRIKRRIDDLTITAMIRPSTPRRAPARTARILNQICYEMGERVQISVFGCSTDELRATGLQLDPRIDMLGELRQTEVAEVLRSSTVFLDLSDYQAFGRTAAEAMACGTISLAPSIGGAVDFIENNVNSFLVDTRSDADILDCIRVIASLSEGELRSMSAAAIESVAGMTPVKAALSELRALNYI